jgi:alpha-galactosidase
VRETIAAEPQVLILPDMSGADDERLDVQVAIPDIWSSDSADAVERVAHWVLDALGVGSDARFDLEFIGDHSIERALEARRRQREGTLEEW